MNLVKTLATSLFLFTSALSLAAGNIHPTNLLYADSDGVQNDLISETSMSGSSPAMLIKPTLFQKLEMSIFLGFNVTTNPNTTVSKALFFANPQFGPVFGAALALPIRNYFGVRIEVAYSEDVFSGIPVLASPFLFGNKLGYIDIPVEFQVKPIKDLCITLGGIYSILISNSSFVQSQTIGETASQQYPNNNVSNTVIRGTFGATYKLGFLLIGGRLSFGSPYNDSHIRRAGIGQITLGYAFRRKFQDDE